MNADARQAAAEYMDVNSNEVALTNSTTMGIGLIITGLHIREGQEMLTARFDYFATHEAIHYQAERSGASFREISHFRDNGR